jgi:SNF2 family DNA or RNA helicase
VDYSQKLLIGEMSSDNRNSAVTHIQTPESRYRIFLISTLIGGTGLNLTEANHALIIDEHWNPSYEAQAVDRIWREGQMREVNVYRFLTSDTVDQKIQVKQ